MMFCKGCKAKNNINCGKWINTEYVNTRFFRCDKCWEAMKNGT